MTQRCFNCGTKMVRQKRYDGPLLTEAWWCEACGDAIFEPDHLLMYERYRLLHVERERLLERGEDVSHIDLEFEEVYNTISPNSGKLFSGVEEP